MKTVPIGIKNHLMATYNRGFYDAMTKNVELVDRICSFRERHEVYEISYSQAFFACCKIDVYELEGEYKLFTSPGQVFGIVPISSQYSFDWVNWLSKAKLIKELR